MLALPRDLIAHKGHANAALLTAIRRYADAAADPELCELLRHMLIANRFWLLTVLGLPFALEDESRAADSIDPVIRQDRRTREQEADWLATVAEADLARVLKNSLIPGGQCSVAQALMQVCMHSHGHRAQCAKLFRKHGGVPPATDFILWLSSRQTPGGA